MEESTLKTDLKIILKTIPPGEIKNDTPHYGLKEHTSFRARGLSRPAAVDVQSGFVLATTLTPASEHDSRYLPYLTIASCHTKDPIERVYGDKGYYGHPNRAFLHMSGIKDGFRLDSVLEGTPPRKVEPPARRESCGKIPPLPNLPS